MSPSEERLMKRLERVCGRVPIGALDLVRTLAHPDVIQFTLDVLDRRNENAGTE